MRAWVRNFLRLGGFQRARFAPLGRCDFYLFHLTHCLSIRV